MTSDSKYQRYWVNIRVSWRTQKSKCHIMSYVHLLYIISQKHMTRVHFTQYVMYENWSRLFTCRRQKKRERETKLKKYMT